MSTQEHEYPEAVREAPKILDNGVTKERVHALLDPNSHVNEIGELGYDGALYGRKVLEALFDSLSSYDDPFNSHRQYAQAWVDPSIGLRDVNVPTEEVEADGHSFSVPAISDQAVEQLESVLEEVDREFYDE